MDESDHWNYKDWARHIVDFMMPVMMYVALKIER
jgi:hypothetical protein